MIELTTSFLFISLLLPPPFFSLLHKLGLFSLKLKLVKPFPSYTSVGGNADLKANFSISENQHQEHEAHPSLLTHNCKISNGLVP